MMNLNKIKTILWDWNGTLLNDVNHSIRSMNCLLNRRSMELLCKDKYHNVFTFPVKDYYEKLGFDFTKEPFEIPAEEFIVEYNHGIRQIPLYSDAVDALKFFKQMHIQQYIISAMQHDFLLETVHDRSIEQYFTRVNGIEDNLGFGKTALALQIIKEEKLDKRSTLFIGDTLHDFEVAAEAGIHCVLVANGHQSHLRLTGAGVPVFDSLAELVMKIRML